METLRIGDGQLDRDAITAPAVDKILDEALKPPPPPALGWSIWLTTTMRGTLASSAYLHTRSVTASTPSGR